MNKQKGRQMFLKIALELIIDLNDAKSLYNGSQYFGI